jgi:hypothetical protein
MSPIGLACREAPASIGQRMLWLIDRHHGEEGALNYPVLLRLRGALDVPRLREALDGLVARHESLRTTFARRQGLLTQVIHDTWQVAVDEIDLTAAADPDAALRRAIGREVASRIDASVWPFRAVLWRLRPDHHVLCVNAHHLVTDAWSCGILVADLTDLLRQPPGGAAGLPAAGWQYRHFVLWQRRQLAGDGLRAHRDYWRARLADPCFPALPPRPDASEAGRGTSGTAGGVIDDEIGERLRALARRQRTTLFAVMLAVCCALLRQRTAETDVAIASLVAGRTRPEVMRTLGFFANMVVLRTRFAGAVTFIDLLRHAHVTVTEALAHQDLPYHLLPPQATRAGSRRADDFVFQMLPEIPPPHAAGGLELEVLLPEVASRFDLELALVPRRGGFAALLQHAPDRVDPAWAAAFVSDYIRLAADVARRPGGALARVAG